MRGPDLIFGGDMRAFSAPRGRFDGVIGGPPCQDFSTARRGAPTGEGVEMLEHFARVVTEAKPAWWLLENVPAAPPVRIEGYSWLRIPLDARECGAMQRRPRHFQFGHRAGLVPIVTRRPRPVVDESPEPCCMASEASRPGRRGWSRFCELQGLPRDFDLPGFTRGAKYRAVGNGVHFAVACTIAAAIRDAREPRGFVLCACGCARPVTGRRVLATVACRKRAQRERDRAGVTGPGPDTPGRSQFGAAEVTARAATPIAESRGAR